MSGARFDHVPTIDVAPLYDGDEHDARALAGAATAVLRDVGFAYVTGHRVPGELTAALRHQSRLFFDLPMAEKTAIAINEWHRGYMAPDSSLIVTSSVADVTRPNRSESLLILHERAADDPDVVAGKPLQGPNRWPVRLPALRATALDYVDHMQDLARRLTGLIALCLGVSPASLLAHFQRPTTFLRLLHYPPQAAEPGLFGSAPHTDYGFITLLAQDDVGGLQVRNAAGDWIDAPPVPGNFVLNVGDMLAHWSGGLFASTPHRVINTSGRERYSQPFFFDPAMDTVIMPLAGARTDVEPICYGDYVMERLDKNYSYRHRTAD